MPRPPPATGGSSDTIMTGEQYGGPERRTQPRALMNLDSELRLRCGTALHVQTLDLSSGGAFVRSPRPLPVGTALQVAFNRGPRQNPLVLPAEVVRVGTAREGRAGGLGLRFVALTALDEGLLRALVERRGASRGGPSFLV